MSSQPTPKAPMQAARTSPQCRRSMSATSPPGRVTAPDVYSLVAVIAPTPRPLRLRVAWISGSITRKLW